MSWSFSQQIKMELEPFFKPVKMNQNSGAIMKFLDNILHIVLHISVAAFRFVQYIVYFGQKKVVPPVKNPLLLKSATVLAKEIRERKIKSEDVINAYIDRISEVDPYINAVVDRCYKTALDEARNADALVASGNHSVQQLAKDLPLLGVPFTVKIIFKVKGVRCTSGCEFLHDQVAHEDADAVALLRQAGAVVLATTNMPEFGMGFESFNNLHGRTNNPYDTTRTSGGSSGGESALISAAGSVFGIGNDLAGSVRVPAHFTGIYSHKPTRGVVPNSKCFPDLSALSDYLYTGPMCRYAEDLSLTMNVLSSQYEPRPQFGVPVDFKKLKIRFLTSLPHPLVYPLDEELKQGLMNAVAHFERTYGTTPTETDIPLLRHAFDCFHHAVIGTANKHHRDLSHHFTLGRADSATAKLEAVKFLFNRSRLSLGAIICLNFRNFPLVYRKRDVEHWTGVTRELEGEFERLLDEDTVLFMPTFPTPAPRHWGTLPMLPSTAYTSVFDVLGLPSTQCHLGFKEGLPFGMQIVGRKNNDALTVACAVELEKALGGWLPPGKVPSVQ